MPTPTATGDSLSDSTKSTMTVITESGPSLGVLRFARSITW